MQDTIYQYNRREEKRNTARKDQIQSEVTHLTEDEVDQTVEESVRDIVNQRC